MDEVLEQVEVHRNGRVLDPELLSDVRALDATWSIRTAKRWGRDAKQRWEHLTSVQRAGAKNQSAC